VDRIKRLEFPNRPGVYRMLSQSGQVLYVGKATSLKSRVNSYFRGQKGRDRKKLEMLAQVWGKFYFDPYSSYSFEGSSFDFIGTFHNIKYLK
jgi:hypothetical protein